MNTIPLIDFGPFLDGTTADRRVVAAHIFNAFNTSGFICLSNHGIPSSAISEVFIYSKHFFARPLQEKNSLSWTGPRTNRGYIAHSREKLSRSHDSIEIDAQRESNPDLKETMEIGCEGVEGVPNCWPDQSNDEGKHFKRVMLNFLEHCKDMQTHVMHAIAIGMGLPEQIFDRLTDGGNLGLRLLHYPAVSKNLFHLNPEQVRAGEHSDYGAVTLLFQDCCGGLQIRSPDGTFVDVTPVPDTVIVNAGDMLARWSNDIIKSTPHRVVEPLASDESGVYPARYSVACFCSPNVNEFVEALPGTHAGVVESKKYSAVNASDYFATRLQATIP
ncbi:hypothetical protein APHAL10511_003984 [Amanita phalloides]|nr:hypothetical protein APHAL10511_003984 [Amanita phalloides]